MPTSPALYRVVSTFERQYLWGSGRAVVRRSGMDPGLLCGRAGRFGPLELMWFYHTQIPKRFHDAVYQDAFAGLPDADGVPSKLLSCVDELFVSDQARNLLRYLRATFGTDRADHNIRSPDFPLRPNRDGPSALPHRGTSVLWRLSEAEGYPLGFDVRGRLSLRRPQGKGEGAG